MYIVFLFGAGSIWYVARDVHWSWCRSGWRALFAENPSEKLVSSAYTMLELRAVQFALLAM